MASSIIRFKKRSDGGPKIVGPFATQQLVDEHLRGLANRDVRYKAVQEEIAGWRESLEFCDGIDEWL